VEAARGEDAERRIKLADDRNEGLEFRNFSRICFQQAALFRRQSFGHIWAHILRINYATLQNEFLHKSDPEIIDA
jgi:hypothetical protein